jgi:predicted O-methyltransferase YrrM
MAQESLLKKAKRTIRKEGFRSLAKKTWDYTDHKLEPAKRAFSPAAAYAINNLDPKKRDVPTLLRFVFDRFGGLIRPAQVRWEITNLATIVHDLKPKTVLEIGTAKGGTLFLFSRLADPHATIVSVDLPGGEFGGGYPEWKTKLYKTFHLPEQKMHLLRADSHKIETLETVRKIFEGTGVNTSSPVDFLFIDGDHTYDGVRKDFELFSPLVRKGGVIAFHDIAVHPPEVNCEVDKFWNQIKKGDSMEFIQNREQHWAGIGVYFV